MGVVAGIPLSSRISQSSAASAIFTWEELEHCCSQFPNQFIVLVNRLVVLAIINVLTKDGVTKNHGNCCIGMPG